ncbi:hypothetical protein C8F01DRAFT_1133716 [Mycena amicta]|nr:hypothetical protein C8F01DRAFT_1133716 [Mycena amicta]
MIESITHRGFCVWLQNSDGNRLALGHPKFNEARDEVTVAVELQKKTLYSIDWCKVEDAPRVNARCDIFRPDKEGKWTRIGNQFMSAAASDMDTQKRTSIGRLERPLERDAWLSSAYSGGCISLEIRRLNVPPKETTRRDNHAKADIYEMVLDYLDSEDPSILDPESGSPMRPFVTFVFEFKSTKAERRVQPQLAGRETRTSASTSQVLGFGTSESSQPQTPSRTSNQANASERQSEREIEPSPDRSRPISQAAQDKRPHQEDWDEVEKLLERKKRARMRREVIEQENSKDREETERLLENLRESVKSEEKSLAEAERQSQEMKVRSARMWIYLPGVFVKTRLRKLKASLNP